MLESLDEDTLKNPEIIKIKRLLNNLNSNTDTNSISELENQLKQNPQNKDARLELSSQLLQSNQIEKGFQELLILFEQDPKWNEEAAKKNF